MPETTPHPAIIYLYILIVMLSGVFVAEGLIWLAFGLIVVSVLATLLLRFLRKVPEWIIKFGAIWVFVHIIGIVIMLNTPSALTPYYLVALFTVILLFVSDFRELDQSIRNKTPTSDEP